MGGILAILILLVPVQEPPDYPLRQGRPTSEGITRFVEEQAEHVIEEFEAFVNDTLYDIWIYPGDLADNGRPDSLELGFYCMDEIYIGTAELFEAYCLADLSEKRRRRINESNKFVKGVMFHELTHDYVHQVAREMVHVDQVRVNHAYLGGIRVADPQSTFGVSFIEEGICEYVVESLGELITPEKAFVPASVEELLDRQKRYLVMYKYSSAFLGGFLDREGLKEGIKILLHNPPPVYAELLDPELYFDRLKRPFTARVQ